MIPWHWVFGIVIACGVGSLVRLITTHMLTAPNLTEWTTTFATGIWYSLRFRYTVATIPCDQTTLSLFFTAITAACGLTTLFLVSTDAWSIVLAVTLLLAIEKDLEIIVHHKNLIRSTTRISHIKKMEIQEHRAPPLVCISS